MTHKLSNVFKWTLFSMLLALGWLLPFLTGQIKTIGNMLLPMHIPVFLCGFILGPWFGLGLGIMLPLTRALIFGQPVLVPFGLCMALELATYGFISGLFMSIFKKAKTKSKVLPIILSLLIAQIVGRISWAFARLVALYVFGTKFNFEILLTSGFVTAIPGIVLQWLLIPPLVFIANKKIYKE